MWIFRKSKAKILKKTELKIVSGQFLRIFNAAISEKMHRTKHSNNREEI